MILCVLDTETTGLSPEKHEVIQVAGIFCDDRLNELERVSFRIRPQFIERADKRALEINGYDPRTWKPKFFSHKKAYEFLSNRVKKYELEGEDVVFTGQNVMFDYRFLQSGFTSAGVKFPFTSTTLDLMDIAKMWSAEKNIRLKKLSLKYLAEFTQQVNTNPHDAEADAEVTLDVLRWFINDLKKENKNVRKRVRKLSQIKV